MNCIWMDFQKRDVLNLGHERLGNDLLQVALVRPYWRARDCIRLILLCWILEDMRIERIERKLRS